MYWGIGGYVHAKIINLVTEYFAVIDSGPLKFGKFGQFQE